MAWHGRTCDGRVICFMTNPYFSVMIVDFHENGTIISDVF